MKTAALQAKLCVSRVNTDKNMAPGRASCLGPVGRELKAGQYQAPMGLELISRQVVRGTPLASLFPFGFDNLIRPEKSTSGESSAALSG